MIMNITINMIMNITINMIMNITTNMIMNITRGSPESVLLTLVSVWIPEFDAT